MCVSKCSIYEWVVFHFYLLVYYLTFPQKDEWLTAVALIVLVVILVILEYLRTGLIISPLIVWYVFWLGIIALGRMDLGMYPFFQTWSRKLMYVVIMNTAIFFWLYWAGEYISGKVKPIYKTQLLDGEKEILSDIVIVMMLASVAAFIVNAVSIGYLPQFTEDANLYRQSFVVTKYYRVVNVLRFTFGLIPFAVLNSAKVSKKMMIVFLAILMLVTEMLSGWRSYTLQAIIFLMTSIFLAIGPRERTDRAGRDTHDSNYTVPIIVLSGVIAVVFISVVALSRDGVFGTVKRKLSYLLYTLYMYIAPNFLNLQSGMENVEVIHMPIYTTEAFWGLFTSWDKMPQLPDIDQFIGAFNVSTYLHQPHIDFGIPGTLVCSSLLGMISGSIFEKCLMNKTICSVVLLGIINITIFLLHNNYFFRASSTVIWIAAGAVIDLILYLKEIKNGKKIAEKQYTV